MRTDALRATPHLHVRRRSQTPRLSSTYNSSLLTALLLAALLVLVVSASWLHATPRSTRAGTRRSGSRGAVSLLVYVPVFSRRDSTDAGTASLRSFISTLTSHSLWESVPSPASVHIQLHAIHIYLMLASACSLSSQTHCSPTGATTAASWPHVSLPHPQPGSTTSASGSAARSRSCSARCRTLRVGGT
jgi:hypothetical protein